MTSHVNWIWVMDPMDPNAEPLVESAPGTVRVDCEEPDRLQMHIRLGDDDNAITSVFMSRSQALKLAGQLIEATDVD